MKAPVFAPVYHRSGLVTFRTVLYGKDVLVDVTFAVCEHVHHEVIRITCSDSKFHIAAV